MSSQANKLLYLPRKLIRCHTYCRQITGLYLYSLQFESLQSILANENYYYFWLCLLSLFCWKLFLGFDSSFGNCCSSGIIGPTQFWALVGRKCVQHNHFWGLFTHLKLLSLSSENIFSYFIVFLFHLTKVHFNCSDFRYPLIQVRIFSRVSTLIVQ